MSHTDLLAQFRNDLLDKLPERLLCVDVGARWGADNTLMLLKHKAKLLCFDPDAEECARLQALHPIDEVEYVPQALSQDGSELTLYTTREPACSSIFPPIEAIYSNYPALDIITPVQSDQVPSTTLDRYLATVELGLPDLYKLDTQGSELDILKGGVASLAGACMIDIEVEFNPLYGGQALFGDVDVFMRSHGFVLWRLPLLVHYTPAEVAAASTAISSISTPPGRFEVSNPGNGQLFWAQAHYVRSKCLITDPTDIDAHFARKAAAITSAYGYWDLALMALKKCPDTQEEAQVLQTLLQ